LLISGAKLGAAHALLLLCVVLARFAHRQWTAWV
jgi:hypothetical protein